VSYDPPIKYAVAAFGELIVAEPTPIVQLQAVHGLGGQTDAFSFGSGAVSASDGEFIASTGTTANSFAAILSLRGLRYKPGNGAQGRFTCRFTTPVANSIQHAGLINIGNRLCFGYNGTSFGSFHNHSGYAELRTLTVTTASTTAANATITIDSVAHVVALTNNGSLNITAAEIADGLNALDALNDYTANQDVITIRFGIVGPKTGTFSFVHADAVAVFATVKVGVALTTNFTAQADWNIDTLGAGTLNPSGVTMSDSGSKDLDPTSGGLIGEIQYQYLGYGNILYQVADPYNVGVWIPVHVVQWLIDGNTGVNMSDSGYRIGWVSTSQGSTTDLIVKGASAALFNDGKYLINEESRSLSNEILSVASGVEHHVLTIRNRTHFGGVSNGSEVLAILLRYATESTKGTAFKVYKNITSWNVDLIYSYVDETDSIVEYSTTTASAPVLGSGRLIDTGIKLSAGEGQINLDLLQTFLNQGESLSITGTISSGAAKDLSCSLTWKEDI